MFAPQPQGEPDVAAAEPAPAAADIQSAILLDLRYRAAAARTWRTRAPARTIAVMRRVTGITVLAAVACLLASGCARPTVHTSGVMYTCCAQNIVSTRWQPGQQLPVVWTRTGRLAPGQPPSTLTLSAVLIGPFSKVAALKNAIHAGQDHAAVRAAAPQLRISRNPPRSPESVIAIPADAPPGFYDLQIRVVFSTGGSVSGDSIVTVG